MVTSDQVDRTIDAARRSFNRELLSGDYRDTHGDNDQVDRLVAFLDPMPGGTYLDLATGNGDLAFAVGGHQTKAHVIGIDIADRAISRNQTTAREQGCTNVEFLVADGRKIDFPNASFDGITWRYALHHFPQLETTLADARRVLKPAAVLVVADAVRHPKDDRDFINRFQALEPDGHVRIYTANGLVDLFRANGFEAQQQFRSTITFTRHLNADYRDLVDGTPLEILELYDVTVAGDRAVLTFDVLNVKFAAPTD